MQTIKLPWPPSVNHYWFTVACKGGGRLVIGAKGKKFREDVCQIVRDLEILPRTYRLSVFILACPPDKRKRDLDNILKPILDALEHAGVYLDDSQIDLLAIQRNLSPELKGSVFVSINQC